MKVITEIKREKWKRKVKEKSENVKVKSEKLPMSSEWRQGGGDLVIGIEKWKWLVESKVKRQNWNCDSDSEKWKLPISSE